MQPDATATLLHAIGPYAVIAACNTCSRGSFEVIYVRTKDRVLEPVRDLTFARELADACAVLSAMGVVPTRDAVMGLAGRGDREAA